MKQIVIIILTVFMSKFAFTQNCKLQIEGDLSKEFKCYLKVTDKSSKHLCSIYKVGFFIVEVKDTNNKSVIGIDGCKISGFTNNGDTLNAGDFTELILKNLPLGKYYIVFETIICVKMQPQNSNDGDFRLPDERIEFIKN